MRERKTKTGYSNASQLLGMNITFADREAGVVEASFDAKHEFHNSIGNIQGGILVAMLDDLMGYALGITLPETQFAPTANMNVSFLRPVASGVIKGKGIILKNSGDVFHLSAKLYNETGDVIAAATSRSKLGNKVN